MTWHDKIPATIITWVFSNITSPIKGFEHKKNPDGSFFSVEQQLQATNKQILYLILYFLNRGKSPDEILQTLHAFKKG